MSTEPAYPLGVSIADALQTATGRPLREVTLEAVVEGQLTAHDVRISGETLRMQAAIAEQAGFSQVAQNLRRAAELVSLPESEVLRIYTALRPRRSTYDELLALARKLEQDYAAPLVAQLVREAAAAYQARGLAR